MLVPGAGGAAWFWHRTQPLFDALGHRAVAVDLPADDPTAGLPEYAALVADAVQEPDDTVLVGQSMGGFTVPVVAERTGVSGIVLLNAMIPLPGETPGEWFATTGCAAAERDAALTGGYSPEFDLETYFLHDVPAEVAAEGEPHQREEADITFGQPCAIRAWPAIPTRVLAGRDDRFFPLGFQRRLARERLGLEVEVVPGGHLAALAYPDELVAVLVGRPG